MISVDELARRIGELRVVDVRFGLGDPEEGRRAHAAGHVPGAAYLHLHDDLSDPDDPVPGQLADAATVAAALGRAGVGPGDEVVAYDDARIFTAARLAWAAEVLGLGSIRVLDGGWPAWVAAGGAVSAADDAPPPAAGPAVGVGRPELYATLEDVRRGSRRLVDCRMAETYDAAGEHIPGALHLPAPATVDAEGRLRPAEQLRELAAELDPAEPITLYCGGGISATQGLLALRAAGYQDLQVYDGSWAEWSAHPELPREPNP